MGAWAFVKGLFSAPEIVKTGCEVVKSGATMLDKAFYTSQEKAENALTYAQLALERVKVALSESSVQAITRRFLSFAIIGQCMFLTEVAAILWLLGKTNDAGFMLDLLKFWAVPLSAVVIFYFGYYGVTSIIKAKNGKQEG